MEIDGGGYTFMPNGLLYPLGSGSPQFKTNACTGTGYVPADSELSKQLYVGSAGGPTRLVWRRTDPSGAALAWKFTTATENVVATQMYELDNDGTCDPVSGGAVQRNPGRDGIGARARGRSRAVDDRMIGMDKRDHRHRRCSRDAARGHGVTATALAAAAKKYTACVKKSSGEVRLLLGKSKKCKKG